LLDFLLLRRKVCGKPLPDVVLVYSLYGVGTHLNVFRMQRYVRRFVKSKKFLKKIFTMNVSERIKRIDLIENQRGTKLSKVLGIHEMTIRSIVEGGNPGYKTIVKILEAYPTLNARWLLLGEEPMYLQGNSYGESSSGLSLAEESAVEYMRGSVLYNFPLLVLEVEALRKTVEELRKIVEGRNQTT
jgi:DNA-binding phage protein